MGALNKKVDKRLNGQKIKKDPGLPKLGQWKQAKVKKEQKAKLQLKLEAAKKAKQPSNLADMMQRAERNQQVFDATQPEDDDTFERTMVDAAAAGQKDNSRKAYFREFRKVLENADVILEILDARDPIGTRTKHVERMIMDSGVNKKIILVLNKIDLVPRDNVEAWLKYLRNEYPAIAFKASTQSQRHNLSQSHVSTQMASENLLGSAECLGAESLIRLLKNYSRSSNMKTALTVGIIGYPNVGKSSVINSLKRSKVCGVGSTPGFTKVAQQVTLDKHIKLLDCPGIVFAQQGQDGQSDAEIALRNCIKVELLADPVAPVEVIVARCPPARLMGLYNVGYFNNAHEFLVLLARERGKLMKGGIADIQQAAKQVLNDWNNGRIRFYTIPPSSKQSHLGGAQLINTMDAAFDIDLQSDADRVLHNLSAEFDPNAIAMQTDDQPMQGGNDDFDMMVDDDAAVAASTSEGRMVVG